MAKQDGYRFSKEKRDKLIKNCEECKGSPETESTNLQGMQCTYCTKCMNVVDWVKNGVPTKITSKIKATLERPNDMDQKIEINVEEIPGKTIKFEGFKIC